MNLVNVLLSDPHGNVRRRCGVENTSHNMFERNDMENCCNLAKTLIMSGGDGLVSYSVLQVSSSWQRIQYLAEGKEVTNDGEGEKVEMKEEEMFEVE